MHYKTILILATTSAVSARSIHSLKRADPVLPAGWSAAGCYSDSWDRTLATQASANNNQLTVESCIASCSGYTYAGVENGNECYCSNTLASTGSKTADGDCTASCSGNGGEICGGGWRLSVYKYTAAAWPDPPHIPIVYPPHGWIDAGCYSDSWTRTLANSVSVSGPFSHESCVAACDSAGYAYAGVENGNECYCSNTVASTGLKTSDADCLMPCAGNADQRCGGGWRINIFQREDHATLNWPPAGWSSLGCYTDSWTRTLAGSNYTKNGMVSTTDCIFTCLSTRYKFAGIENGNECYCSNAVATTGIPASGADCSTPCAAYPSNKCGGPWRLDIYWDSYWSNTMAAS